MICNRFHTGTISSGRARQIPSASFPPLNPKLHFPLKKSEKMTIFKCKMCGGTLEFNPGDTVAVCDSCGTKQTLPKLDDDRRANLYDRANHFRRSNEYDKAMGIYEQILAEDNTDAEAYWSLVLCRYGIEYVEDPATHRRVPTVNRAQFTSIFDDDNYKSALHYADAAQREVYESEAKAINEIQKGILAISQKEQPFDVFICYKETDASGRRTPDSVLANDLYHQLTQEGFKVFFARITLEDKLGTAYEPYIFAALNSAKVMVVLGTKPEYFNAVWVKNEWSRYLALVKNSGGKKMLIPAYKDMDPYDLPEEFSHLQAQDMGKLGFMQDLIRGIKKIISADAPKAAVKETVVVSGGNAAVEPLLKRAFMFLEDGNWQEADTYCEKVLDQDPENAQAYLGKLMAELGIPTQDELKENPNPLTELDNYKKALRFADDSLRTVLTEADEYIHQRNLQTAYDNAKQQMETASNELEFNHVAELFSGISGFQDADELREECIRRAGECMKDEMYYSAKEKMDAGRYEKAIEEFKSISDWRDSAELISICQQKDGEKTIALKKRRKKIYILAAVAALAIVVIIAASSIISYVGILQQAKANVSDAKVGSIVTFGTYTEESDTLEKSKIDWRVLAKEDDRILVISDRIIDAMPYHNVFQVDVTWETCSLRKWLNSAFINSAFNSAEKKLIIESEVLTEKASYSDTDPGNNTKDKIFLLSESEFEKYLHSDGSCFATNYATEKTAEGYSTYLYSWWLRSPGANPDSASDVFISTSDVDSTYAAYPHNGVRPAMWISLE